MINEFSQKTNTNFFSFNFSADSREYYQIIPGCVYEQYLVKLESTPLSTHDNSLDGYPRELVSCLQGKLVSSILCDNLPCTSINSKSWWLCLDIQTCIKVSVCL